MLPRRALQPQCPTIGTGPLERLNRQHEGTLAPVLVAASLVHAVGQLLDLCLEPVSRVGVRCGELDQYRVGLLHLTYGE